MNWMRGRLFCWFTGVVFGVSCAMMGRNVELERAQRKVQALEVSGAQCLKAYESYKRGMAQIERALGLPHEAPTEPTR